jgi:thiamine-monophosphate kinase
MLVSKIGEFGLIERFKKVIKTDSSVIKGPGDDCAVIKFNKDNYLIFSCDMIVQDIDFTLKDAPYLIGRKSLAVTLSDIAACAGLPRYGLISIGMPPNTSVEFLDKVTRGILSLAKKYKINIVGGDISRARKLVLNVSLLGIVEKKNLVLRKGAKIGDIIFVSGTLGGSIFGKHLRFTPRIKESRFLVKNFRVNSMIDISDSLVQDLGHILEQSKVGAIIYEELIPLSKQARNLADALYMGEDFELLFTVSRNEAKKILSKKLNNFEPIGEITSRKHGLRLIDKSNREKIITPKGFQHF